MKHGYIRLWPTGPTKASQMARLTALGVAEAQVHCNDQRPRRRQRRTTGEAPWATRDLTINALAAGDELVVACPAVLGISFDDVMRALGWVEEQQAVLLDAEAATEIRGISASMEYARRAVRQLAVMRTDPARRTLAAKGTKTGRCRIELQRPLNQLLEMWWHPERFTADDVAVEAGVTRPSIYRLFKGIPRRPPSSDAPTGTAQPSDAVPQP